MRSCKPEASALRALEIKIREGPPAGPPLPPQGWKGVNSCNEHWQSGPSPFWSTWGRGQDKETHDSRSEEFVQVPHNGRCTSLSLLRAAERRGQRIRADGASDAGVHPWVVSKGHECESSCRKPRDAELTGSVHMEPEQGRWASRYGWATYTQVPGVQLHLLLQLREQLVVKRLQLGMERKQRSALTYSLREEPNGRGDRSPRQGCPGRWVPPWKRGACLTREPMTLVEPGGPRREC